MKAPIHRVTLLLFTQDDIAIATHCRWAVKGAQNGACERGHGVTVTTDVQRWEMPQHFVV